MRLGLLEPATILIDLGCNLCGWRTMFVGILTLKFFWGFLTHIVKLFTKENKIVLSQMLVFSGVGVAKVKIVPLCD